MEKIEKKNKSPPRTFTNANEQISEDVVFHRQGLREKATMSHLHAEWLEQKFIDKSQQLWCNPIVHLVIAYCKYKT